MDEIDWKIQIFALISICYTIFKFITYLLSQKEIELSKFKKTVLIWIVIIAVVWPYWNYVESTSVKDGGIYYVNLFEKEDSQKNYRVPGLIYKNDYGPHLYEVYWSNGGSSSFEHGADYADLIIGKKISAKDDDDKEWFIELTNEKAIVKK